MKKKILIFLSILCVIGILTGCTNNSNETPIIKIPESVNKYVEEFQQEWPDVIQEVVDDVWSDLGTNTIIPDFTPPEEDPYIPTDDVEDEYTEDNTTNNESTTKTETYGDLKVHFIDVGQADCILFIYDEEVMMIDAGNNGDAETITNYLNKLDIGVIDHFILTHPHEDHIGSADTVIDNFTVENVYMTKYPATSKTYKDVIKSINNKTIIPTYVTEPLQIEMNDAIIDIYPPADINTNEINNSSIITKITHGENTMLFSGDTETDAEKELLELNYDLEADLFKANHHGSGGSNSYVWLREVNPKYVVIQSGEGNTYGHPHEEALSRFNDIGAYIYRNDTLGDIIAISDGNDIEFNKEGITPTRKHTEK